MKIYNYLKKDHQLVNNLFDRLIAAKTDATRIRLQDKLINEILIHAMTEQNTFYKKLKKYDESEECANHGIKEHKDIKSHIDTLIKKDFGTKEWLKAVRELKKTVKHHVREEEGKMFKLAREVLTDQQAEDLTKQMSTMKTDVKREMVQLLSKKV